MKRFSTPPAATHTLRALARLLGYPDRVLREHLRELQSALHAERTLPAARLAELDALIESLGRRPLLDVEADYVELFDRGHATSLHLFEHVHGDSRERGPAMIDLAQTYEQAGLFLAEGEMPDYLPVVLEYASTQPPPLARAFLAEIAHIFNALFAALQQRATPYAAVLGALLELAGEPAQPVRLAAEEPLDALWEEPLAFDGCSVKGQGRPEAQPVHIVRKGADIGGARA